MPYFEKPDGRVKIQKYYAILNSKTSNKSFIIQLFFFLCQVFLLISHRTGKAKRKEKRNASSRPVKEGFFFNGRK